jgi:carotenoid cleavage dioxygenase-like enzyme
MLTQPAWSPAVTQVGREFPRTPLEVLSGQLPPGLRGTLYRNGPARLQRGDRQVGHWFDGDGAILSVRFNGEDTTAQYRFVQTQGYQEEEDASTLLYGNYGMTAPGPFWRRWTKPVKNAANTSVLALRDRLLALWEGGKPHALDLDNLETYGLEAIDLPTYSAHPKEDLHSGEIYNFGVEFGRQNAINLFACDRQGKVLRRQQHPLDRMSLIHDFVLAGDYLVFFVPPLDFPIFSILFGLSSFSESVEWQPERGTQILIFDRHSLELVSRSTTEPWFQWHYANGYRDEAGNLVIDVVRYSDFTTNQRLKEIASGNTRTAADGQLYRIVLDPQSGKQLDAQPLFDRFCEFPSVAPEYRGRSAPRTYLSMHRRGVDPAVELYGAIGFYDADRQTLHEFDFGEARYPMEPIYAPHSEDEDKGWLVTVVYDGEGDRSEVWVFDAHHLDEPVCRLGLPEVIPIGFHGTFTPRV